MPHTGRNPFFGSGHVNQVFGNRLQQLMTDRDTSGRTAAVEGSEPDRDAEAEIAEFVKEQAAMFRRLDEVSEKPVKIRTWRIL